MQLVPGHLLVVGDESNGILLCHRCDMGEALDLVRRRSVSSRGSWHGRTCSHNAVDEVVEAACRKDVGVLRLCYPRSAEWSLLER
jgi:hypothetical protein